MVVFVAFAVVGGVKIHFGIFPELIKLEVFGEEGGVAEREEEPIIDEAGDEAPERKKIKNAGGQKTLEQRWADAESLARKVFVDHRKNHKYSVQPEATLQDRKNAEKRFRAEFQNSWEKFRLSAHDT